MHINYDLQFYFYLDITVQLSTLLLPKIEVHLVMLIWSFGML
jgi:hypothetical protein